MGPLVLSCSEGRSGRHAGGAARWLGGPATAEGYAPKPTGAPNSWTNFFRTTAAVGAQLIGLLFVVATIGSSLSKSQSVAGIRAFLTPTLTCFSGVLLQPLVVLVPWPSDWTRSLMLVPGGLASLVYHL